MRLVSVFAILALATAASAIELASSVRPSDPVKIKTQVKCGTERWSVKTGTDSDAGSVDMSRTKSTTLSTMVGWVPPNPLPPDSRYGPYETTMWGVSATLIGFKSESDSDFHLVLQDDSGTTIIAEIPHPDCVGSGSPFADGVSTARNEFTARYSPSGSFKKVSVPVKVKGIGFFDFLHGQTGVAPNGIEIHPVLDIQFLSFTSEEAVTKGYYTTPIDDPTYKDPEEEEEGEEGEGDEDEDEEQESGMSNSTLAITVGCFVFVTLAVAAAVVVKRRRARARQSYVPLDGVQAQSVPAASNNTAVSDAVQDL